MLKPQTAENRSMSATSIPVTQSADRSDIAVVARAGALLAVVDGICAVAINSLVFHQATLGRTFQGVAASLLGKASLSMGASSVALGLAIHLTVAVAWVAVYVLASRKIPALRRASGSRASFATVGPLLGAFIWVVMNFVIVPMTRLHALPLASAPFEVFLLQHMLVVGPLIVATTP
jgi:hypothetical protein